MFLRCVNVGCRSSIFIKFYVNNSSFAHLAASVDRVPLVNSVEHVLEHFHVGFDHEYPTIQLVPNRDGRLRAYVRRHAVPNGIDEAGRKLWQLEKLLERPGRL